MMTIDQFNASVERYARKAKDSPGQRGLFEESEHPRESEAHDGKKPGEFAPLEKIEDFHASVKAHYEDKQNKIADSFDSGNRSDTVNMSGESVAHNEPANPGPNPGNKEKAVNTSALHRKADAVLSQGAKSERPNRAPDYQHQFYDGPHIKMWINGADSVTVGSTGKEWLPNEDCIGLVTKTVTWTKPGLGTRCVAAIATEDAKPEVVKADCGHMVEKGHLMSASMGTSCPDCYDKMSD